MIKNYLLGVDIGTYESKGVLVNLNGEIVSSYSVSHNLLVPQKGWAEHDAEKVWWKEFCTITKKILDKSNVDPEKINSIGCSAIAPDVLPIDKNGNPLRNGILYGIDTRAKVEIKELEQQLGKEKIFDKTGNELSSQSVGPKILWLKKHEPKIYQEAYKFVTATSFIVGRLADNYVIDHYTAAAGFVPFYNIEQEKWDDEMCKPLISSEKLPDIYWSTDIAGYVSEEAALETGLQPGTPVIAGTADAASEAISVGVGGPGDTMLMYGSSFFLIGVTESLKRDQRLWTAPFLFPNTYCLLGGMSTTGTLTRWFRDNVAKELISAEQENNNNVYTQLTEEAKNIPTGSDGLIVLPYFSGERTPINDPMAKGVFFGLSLIHTRAHLFRSILEGVGHGIKSNLDVLEEIGYEFKNLTAVGGGTKNSLWLQIVSDICFKTQYVPETTIGASYGNTILAGLGVGSITSLKQTRNWIKKEDKIIPNKDIHGQYKIDHEQFLALYSSTKALMHKM